VRITVFDFILMLITSPGRDQVVHGFLFTDDLHLLVWQEIWDFQVFT